MKHTDKFVTQERADKKYCIDCVHFKPHCEYFYDYSLGRCSYNLSEVDGSAKYLAAHMRDYQCIEGKYWETNKIIIATAIAENEKELQKRKDQVEEWKDRFPKNEIVDEAPYLKIKETLVWLKNKLFKRN